MTQADVNDVARHLGVTPQRVRNMLARGQLRGQKIGGRWLIDLASLAAVPVRRGQPLSPRSARALVAIADGRPSDELSPSEVSRLRRRWRALLLEPDPLPSLRSLLSRRAQRSQFVGPDAPALLADPRVAPSGRSDPRSGMADARLAEGYVAVADLQGVVWDHLLTEPALGDMPNVVLYAAPEPSGNPVPWLLIAADLADLGPREAQQARILIREHSANQPEPQA
ncbi:helix-turn-helix domain-containing protein [Pseudactinotalea sp. HY160]|uniref:helix-turn-helix domain-containing protein n=2 Tax=unclassified Pseudactinotalea TaxID=2649176 RepID=UPI00128DCE85|nr:helix-turn-helix domain-containing protein [Pseudactinotalea sp. HY160]MPV48980.1 helix-turn-helix domain-containing protein [Pseudactinotalea sp. HY160]